jgi:hypothetical protein
MSDINDKKIEKLNALLEMVNADFATFDDLIQSSQALLAIITTEKARVDKLVADNKTEDSQEKKDMLDTLNAKLDEKEKNLKYLISELGRAYSDNDEQISAKFSKEVKRLERKIPSKVDLTDIIAKIESLETGINSFPTEITANGEAVRDALELLQDDERLDKSAIKGLDEWYDSILKLASSKNIVAGVRLLRYLSDVNIEGITNGQGIAWNTTTQRFEPVTLGSGGSGMTQEKPTGAVNSSNTIYTATNLPKFVSTDTGTYYNKVLMQNPGLDGFTYTGTGPYTITVPLAPNNFIFCYS